ncbi:MULTISPECIES: hypothetical protein [unclassified Paenibacillus]|uniref:hypothetical protein n=1 Tax=unclassified Paenibacillus TaxID=185978 RepID=UPI0006F33693|nr:hypothetical protein [Paenibacillus sp. Soil750]KRE61937.1 hypothetical protein ASL11_23825 [Paenibacillus sp. Soil750]
MSYYLLVFENTRTPKTKKEFMSWYENLTTWSEDVDYNEISHTTTSLQNWFQESIKSFPAMNGSFAPSDEEINGNEELEERLTDYCVASNAIYMAFAWSVAEKAYEHVRMLATKHNVGFFNVSSENGEIILPDGLKI